MDVKEKRKLSSLVIYSVKSDLFKLKGMQCSKLAINVKAALHFSIEGHIGKRCLFCIRVSNGKGLDRCLRISVFGVPLVFLRT